MLQQIITPHPGLEHLEIVLGCTVSPLAFTMAKGVIIRASGCGVDGERLQDGTQLPTIQAFLNNMMTLTYTAPCTCWL